MPSSILNMDATTPPWASWPPSVQLLILQALLEDGCSLARLAAVSREWQKVVEEHNFTRIKVTLPRLAAFRSMTRRHRSQVKYIWLCVELDHYSSLEAYSGGSQFSSRRDFGLVAKAIRRLFRGLSRWEPSGELLLDISIHSPSDSKYLLRHLTFEPDVPSSECLGLGDVDEVEEAGRNWNDWSAAGKAGTAIKKTFSSINPEDPPLDEEVREENLDRDLEWLDSLPEVPAVTAVLLRQQTRRRWCSSMLTEMLYLLPNLQEVFYEPWRLPDLDLQVEADRGYDRLIESLTLQGVRKLTVFENYNQYYSRHFPGYKHTRTRVTESGFDLNPSTLNTSGVSLDRLVTETNHFWTSKALNRTAALSSRELEHFSASFLVDAAVFFSFCKPSWTWPNLTSLSLTSPRLDPEAAEIDLIKMLFSAAAVACRMPKLETMELWNGQKRLATLFRYQSKPATITWRSTWDFALLPIVIPAWEKVGREHGSGEPVVTKELLNNHSDIKSHGDAIHYLKLSHQVVRPISLQQIRTENKVHRTWEKMRKGKARQDE